VAAAILHGTGRRLVLAIAALVAGPAAASAAGTGVHSVVTPPGPTGCGDGLTTSAAYPEAGLPATMVFNPIDRDVEYRLTRSTQVTRATLRAFMPGGLRADAFTPGEYTCTTPASGYAAFPAKPGLVGAQLRRHGRVRLRIGFTMVNASGRETTLHRTVTVTRAPAATRPAGQAASARPHMHLRGRPVVTFLKQHPAAGFRVYLRFTAGTPAATASPTSSTRPGPARSHTRHQASEPR
jgi:hypothetical protein